MTFWKVSFTTVQQLWCGAVTNPSFPGKTPSLINGHILQRCIDFSQLPNKRAAFILRRLAISLVCSGSFQLSTLFLLKDLFSWVELKNPEHLITLSQACFLRGEEEGGESPPRLVTVKSKVSEDLFFFWRQIRCSNQAVLWGCGWVSSEPLTRLIPQQCIPSS